MTAPFVMVGLGEVLWDLLPSGRVLGGAPTNFAYMTSVLGNRGIVASRVGTDSLGQEACKAMEDLGLTTEYIQRTRTTKPEARGFCSILLAANIHHQGISCLGFPSVDIGVGRTVCTGGRCLLWFACSAFAVFSAYDRPISQQHTKGNAQDLRCQPATIVLLHRDSEEAVSASGHRQAYRPGDAEGGVIACIR